MLFEKLVKFVMCAGLIVIFAFFVIVLIKIVENAVFIKRNDRFSEKLKIINLEYNTLFKLVMYICLIILLQIFLQNILINACETELKEALSKIQFYNFFIRLLTFYLILLLILQFVPTVISSEYLYDNLSKRYHNSSIKYIFDNKKVILYHNDMVILKLSKKKRHEKTIGKLMELYKMKE